MASQGKVNVSTNEIIALLQRSKLPTVIVEGSDDLIVLRHLEAKCSDVFLSVLPVGGRDRVLEIFRRRREIQGPEPILFVADRDTWVLGDIPSEYVSERLMFSEGHSVENDIFRDGNLYRIMSQSEQKVFRAELHDLVRWYALAVTRFRSMRPVALDLNIALFFSSETERERVLQLDNDEVYPEELRQLIFQQYERLFRGKLLISLLMRRLSHSARRPKHSRLSLFEIVGSSPGPILQSLFSEIARLVGSKG